MELYYKDQFFSIQEEETVLDCLLRNGQSYPHSCKKGACQRCMIESPDAAPSAQAQQYLSPKYQEAGIALACQWVPETSMSVSKPDLSGHRITGVISLLEPLNHNTLRVRIVLDDFFPCLPGQYFTLYNQEGVGRSYSSANLPKKDGFVEMHIRIIPGGALSEYLAQKASVGDSVEVEGPFGECLYIKQHPQDYPLLLVGTGTGLAPLMAILKDALAQHHQGPINLFHGALTAEDLYLVDELKALDSQFSQFTYHPCVLKAEGNEAVIAGNVRELAEKSLTEPSETRVYFCGAPDHIDAMQGICKQAGVPQGYIFYDSFVPHQGT